MTPFFSVVIPVYNRAAVLRAALQSVLAQSEQDFEIVVVDDGSADDPKATCDAFGDPRIRCIRQVNGGGGAARNAGISAARGDFIAFLDSDDVFLPRHLQAMRALLTGSRNTAGYARLVVDRGGGRTYLKPPRAIGAGENMASYLLCCRGMVPTTTLVVPRSLAATTLYDTDLREAEDTDFAIRLALGGCAFRMAEKPGGVWNDHYDPHRQSAGRARARLEEWLNGLKTRIPHKAWLGGRGWAIAKGVAANDPLRALRYYLSAVFAGCYGPGLAVIIFLQIFLPARLYRAGADAAIGWLGGDPRAALQDRASR